jgi:hypothetical protein
MLLEGRLDTVEPEQARLDVGAMVSFGDRRLSFVVSKLSQ